MAEFCSQCSLEIFGEDHRDLAGLAKEGFVVAVLCEDCGIIYVDEEGRCRSNCNENHYSKLKLIEDMQSSTNENPTSKTPREHPENPTSES